MRKSRKGSLVYVQSACTPDKGKPGKTSESQKVLPKPGDKLHLSKYGYSTHASSTKRHKALAAAAADNDTLEVLRRLNLLRNLQGDDDAKITMSQDVEYMKRMYAAHKMERMKGSRKGSKKRSKKESKKRSRKGSRKGSKKRSRK
jgi:hypothetical protein